MRRRYVYRKNEETGEVESVEVSSDYERYDARQPVYTDRYLEGCKSTDGTDIGSRAKRREYMKQNGLADADDFKGAWAKAQEQREAFRQGRSGAHREIAEQLGRSAYELRKRKG